LRDAVPPGVVEPALNVSEVCEKAEIPDKKTGRTRTICDALSPKSSLVPLEARSLNPMILL
jgi:hypothetical protein